MRKRRKFDWLQATVRRLGLAVVLSCLLHVWLIEESPLHLPNWQTQTHTIEAHLTALAAQKPANPPTESAEIAVTSPKLSTPAVIKPAVTKPPVTQNEPSPIPVEAPQGAAGPESNDLSQLNQAEMDNAESSAPPSSVNVPLHAAEQTLPEPAVDTADSVNADAYRYVETTFDVRTDPDATVSSRPQGRARIVYRLQANGEQYHLESLIEPAGLAAFVIPDLLQTSDGFLSQMGLQPVNYLYQFGDKKDKTYRAKLDWESAKLQLQTSKQTREVPLAEGTQDLLSFMYQFMFVPPPQNMQLNITNGKKLDSYQYFFAGEETIASKIGALRTIHIYRDNDDGDERSELWLALDYQYVPVKIRKTEAENKVYELLATSIVTDPPAQLKAEQ